MGKYRGLKSPRAPHRLGKYLMHSNKAVQTAYKTDLTTVKLNYSVFIKKDKRFWNVTMHVKLEASIKFPKQVGRQYLQRTYNMYNGYDTPVTLRLNMQSKHNYKSAGAAMTMYCANDFLEKASQMSTEVQ